MADITLDNFVVRAGLLLATDLDEETILMSIEQGAYYGMEATARRIWQLLEQRLQVASLCQQLATEYNIVPDVCRPDVLSFLEELRSEGLIVVE
jgi:hypothetical protein